MNEKMWLAIAFFSFLALILKYVWPIIIKNIDKQSKQIADEINSAKNARQKAETLLKEAEEYLEQSRTYADELIAKAQKEVQKITSDAQKQVEQEISIKTKAALDRIRVEEERAIRDFKVDLVEGSINRFADVIANEISDEDKSKINIKATSDIESSLLKSN